MPAILNTPESAMDFAEVMQDFRISVEEYHEMIRNGTLTTEDRVELLDGYLVKKPSHTNFRASTICRLTEDLANATPNGWQPRIQLPITLSQSEPEPSAAIVRGHRRSFDQRRPDPSDFGIVIEVADTTLRMDRSFKSTLYANAAIPEYWIVNLIDRQIEVYTEPLPEESLYSVRTDYKVGQAVPLILDGNAVAQLVVEDLLP